MGLDFFEVKTKNVKNQSFLYPSFNYDKPKDLMVKGKMFYAIWDEERKIWSTDEFDVQRIVDNEIIKTIEKEPIERSSPLLLRDSSSNQWKEYKAYIKNMPDNYKQLDTKIMFANDVCKKTDYVSRKLSYALDENGDISAYDELMNVLYAPEERQKLEWAIGAIITGDSKKIQKFIAIFGKPGRGKGTFLNILDSLFEGYVSSFNAKELANGNNSFAGDAFADNPLVAIQTDGNLSKIYDNTLLNSIVSHEKIIINEKFKSKYEIKLNSFLFMATNDEIYITNYSSGLTRRLIDVYPTDEVVEKRRYDELMEEIELEKGAIASHCLKVYQSMGKHYYDDWKPKKQMAMSNPIYNFISMELMMDPVLTEYDYITLNKAFKMYSDFVDENRIKSPLSKYKFRDELINYFDKYSDSFTPLPSGKGERNVFIGLHKDEFSDSFIGNKEPITKKIPKWLQLKEQESKLDEYCQNCKAQQELTSKGTPLEKWDNCTTTLSEVDTTKLHYLKAQDNHIFIDFDGKDEKGNKDLAINIESVIRYGFPPTYAEVSKGGQGLHLHYIYDGDVDELSSMFDDNIEIKKNNKGSSTRRALSLCNNLPISRLEQGFLPLKENKKVINFDVATNEKGIRTTIEKCLNKEVHPGTKPNVDFIKKILDDAYDAGVSYDVTDMRPRIMAFGANSSHQSELCLEMINEMHFKSENLPEEPVIKVIPPIVIAFYDVEVFPNLFIVNYKFEGEDNPVIRLINPGPSEMEMLMKYRLVGFNCRRYDNHIIYARYQGYSNQELYNLSQKIINKSENCFFGPAWNLSYTDIYDYAAKKQSLKKWEIELGIHHQELGLPWDQPVDKKLWDKVAEYCDNDVIATEKTWNATQGDFLAREILAELTGLTVNDTTNTLSTRFIFGDNKRPQDEFNYRFMGEVEPGHTCKMEDDGITCVQDDGKIIFPGYKFELGKSSYLDVDEVGEGGYVFSRPGMYSNVWTFDVASMHPSSVIAENLFGDEYTKRFKDILQLRLHIKHKEFDKAKKMFNGALAPYLDDPKKAKALAQALKIVINSVYGLTAASFENPFRDLRNIDNIVAKRGALFMINLRNLVEKMGYTVVHVKTDSIKVANPDKKVIKFINDYGKRFGYNFEVEHKFEKICLVNDAVYIAKLAEDDEEWLEDTSKTRWTATGTQFAVPYVFKSLFSHEAITFNDFCETKQVSKGELYLDMNETLPDVTEFESVKTLRDKIVKKRNGERVVWNETSADLIFGWYPNTGGPTKKQMALLEKYKDMTDEQLDKEIAKGHHYQFIGRVSSFVPIKEGCGGGNLYRYADDKYYTATGAKGFRWLEAETVQQLNKEDCIDKSYHQGLVDDAVETISQFGDFEWFAS